MASLNGPSSGATEVLSVLSTIKDLISVIPLAALAWGICIAFNKIRVKSLLRNIPGPRSSSWLAGNLPEVYDILNIQWHHETTRKYGGVLKINGMLGDEQLYITDSRALHHIIVKEQNIFEEPRSLLVINEVTLGNGLLATIGGHHRHQRKILNPIFSTNHMRRLAPIFHGATNRLRNALDSKLSTNPSLKEINTYEWASRTALEFIAQGGLGTSLDSMSDSEDCSYTEVLKQLVPTVSRLHIPVQLIPIAKPIFKFIPAPVGSALLKYSPFTAIRELKSIADHLEAVSRGIMKQKKAEVMADIENTKGERGNDILSALLRANSEMSIDERLPDDEIIGHITTLMFAAVDTTSSAVSRILHILSQNSGSQTRLRKEIKLARASKTTDEEWDYDELMKLPFLDAVCRETLRLHSPVSWIWRVSRKSTTLPLLRPITGTDGRLITSIAVAKNQSVIVGIAAANRDEAVWGADAWEWKPERWLQPDVLEEGIEDLGLKGGDEWKGGLLDSESIQEARYPGVYSGMMTFSGGGRSCIGFKFALLALKMIIATLIERYSFLPASEEIVWCMNHITVPTIKGKEKERPQLPLKVSLAS